MMPVYATLAYLAVGALVAAALYMGFDRLARGHEEDADVAEEIGAQVNETRQSVGDAWLPLVLAMSVLIWPGLVVAGVWSALSGRSGQE